ncbi:MAG: biotin--[acetyl-CoA-carboxylase] ligase [Treponema sp.]|nr:biotin--[acetyl-CoA-carboxylase] ligase [Treponema sp.]
MIKEFHKTIDSTNSEASRILDSVSQISDGFKALHKKVIYAAHQSAGRGRMGRQFFSPVTGVYMSLIYCPAVSENFNPALYTAAAAVAVSRVIKSLYGKETSIKWVNDVYVNEKKVCGILTEGKIDLTTGMVGAIVVGIGVNIFTPEKDFPEEIRQRAGSVLDSFDMNNPEIPDIHQFVDFLSGELCRIYDSLKSSDSSIIDDVMTEYRNRSNLIGKTVTVTPVIEQESGRYEALVKDITADAKLLVQLKDGSEQALSSGEVTLHI